MIFDGLFEALNGLVAQLTDYLNLLLTTLLEAFGLFGL